MKIYRFACSIFSIVVVRSMVIVFMWSVAVKCSSLVINISCVTVKTSTYAQVFRTYLNSSFLFLGPTPMLVHCTVKANKTVILSYYHSGNYFSNRITMDMNDESFRMKTQLTENTYLGLKRNAMEECLFSVKWYA